MGGEGGPPGILLHLIILHNENPSCFTVMVMTLSSLSCPREVWESSRLLSLVPQIPHSLRCAHCFFVLEATPFSLLPATLPNPDPTGPESHLLSPETIPPGSPGHLGCTSSSPGGPIPQPTPLASSLHLTQKLCIHFRIWIRFATGTSRKVKPTFTFSKSL